LLKSSNGFITFGEMRTQNSSPLNKTVGCQAGKTNLLDHDEPANP